MTKIRPIRTTIFLGLGASLLFIALAFLLGPLVYWPRTMCLITWFFISIYSLLLCRWSETRFVNVIFPIILLLFFSFIQISSPYKYLFFAIGIMSWIRSGICFNTSLLKGLGREIFISLGGAILFGYYTPHTTVGLALGIWLFFLIQSLYFVFYGDLDLEDEDNIVFNKFDNAKRQVEKILSGMVY